MKANTINGDAPNGDSHPNLIEPIVNTGVVAITGDSKHPIGMGATQFHNMIGVLR